MCWCGNCPFENASERFSEFDEQLPAHTSFVSTFTLCVHESGLIHLEYVFWSGDTSIVFIFLVILSIWHVSHAIFKRSGAPHLEIYVMQDKLGSWTRKLEGIVHAMLAIAHTSSLPCALGWVQHLRQVLRLLATSFYFDGLQASLLAHMADCCSQ